MSARALPGFYLEHSAARESPSDEAHEHAMLDGAPVTYVDVSDTRSDQAATYRESQMCIAFFWSSGQLLWGLAILGVAVFKIFENSFYDYVAHFTNISWSWQVFFYIATAPGPVLIAWRLRPPLRFVTLVIAVVLMPLFGIVIAVVIIIFILIGTDAGTITAAFAQYPPEIVIIGNDFYHVVPVIALIVYIALNRRHVFFALNQGMQYVTYVEENHDTRILSRARRAERSVNERKRIYRVRRLSIALFLYQAYFGSLIPVLFYIAFFNPQIIYGTSMTFLTGFGLLVLSLTLSNAVPLAIAVYGWGLGTRALTEETYLFEQPGVRAA